MPSQVEVTCVCGCKRKKTVRTADVKRGWGKYFSKSCKAKAQEKRTGQYADMTRERGVTISTHSRATDLYDLLVRKERTAGVLCVNEDGYFEEDFSEDGSWDAHK
jgi:hypothetical protein